MTTPRGIRNNNPGNIRHSSDKFKGEIQPSKDPAFKQFEAMEYGYRAIFVIIRTYITRYNLTTVGEIITRWAPPSENNTHGYIKAVCKHTALADVSTIDPRNSAQMQRLVRGISFVENGEPADYEQVEQGWLLYSFGGK